MPSLEFGPMERRAALRLIDLALAEDLGIGQPPQGVDFADLSSVFSVTSSDTVLDGFDEGPINDLDRDLTSAALVDPRQTATIHVVVRRSGTLAGLPLGPLVFSQLDGSVEWQTLVNDGTVVESQTVVARVSGPVRSLLIGERTVLNFLQHLSGVATLTQQHVAAAAGTKAVILDTRKTLPGWRILDKYAVRCGGGMNHRMGLFDGVLIKDNHLAAWRSDSAHPSIADAVRKARERSPAGFPIEVEVETLEQLHDALTASPEIVLLDNMSPAQLRDAVTIRDRLAPSVRLEASGGVRLETLREIAATGVDRISVGLLTHSAPALDIAFDWAT